MPIKKDVEPKMKIKVEIHRGILMCYRLPIKGIIDGTTFEIGEHIDLCSACIAREFENRNNYHLKPKYSNIQTPVEVSQFIFELLKDKIPPNGIIFDPDTFIINKEKKWERYCFACEKEKWVNSLQRFDINPFSLAKYFYERGIEDIAIIQKLTYLTYLEVLEKENILLDFGEDFQAWDGGPVIESVFSAMSKDWEKYGNYERILKKIPVLNEEKIIRHCEK
ncbi:795_t:CDS:2 [Racocetra fulgida]|uniref:795_t:CDS:1 n=1 Tax=Racocetra fulgida TaxID=60492 RepID=A0A9N8YTH4_9GLOM|nr:795_t:CDS:2 [Racocetra fulgida]